jgi:hypothetical protein
VKEETATMEPGWNPIAATFLGNRKHKSVAKKNKAYFSFSSAPMEFADIGHKM